MDKKTILVLFGGCSVEYEVSLASGRAVLEAMAQGESLETASADYVSDSAFEEWYGAFCEALQAAAGK